MWHESQADTAAMSTGQPLTDFGQMAMAGDAVSPPVMRVIVETIRGAD